MRCLGGVPLALCVICNILVFAEDSNLLIEQSQQATGASSSQSHAEPASTGAGGLVEYAKICSKTNQPPCATPPRAVSAPPPEYSTEARQANFQGVCVLGIVVESNGRPSHIRVLRSLGMGLDEKAIEAVKRWRFKPAMQDGKPVAVQVAVQVTFHIPGMSQP